MSPAKKAPAAKPPAKPPGEARLFLVYGGDDLPAKRQADAIVAKLCPPEEQAFGLETISPESDLNAEGVCACLRNTLEALRTPPFLGGSKTVYLRGANYFNPMTEPGKFASVKEEVERLVGWLRAGLPEGVHFVVLTPAVHKATAFYKLFDRLGEVHAHEIASADKTAAQDIQPQVKSLLAEKKLTMSKDVVEALLDRTGYSLRQVAMEIEKLSLYLGDRRTVEMEDVYLMVAPVREGKFWEYADAFCSGDLSHTLRVMHRLLGQGQNAVGLLVMLQNRLRDMLVLADCLKRGWLRLSGDQNWPKIHWQAPAEADAVLSGIDKDPRTLSPYSAARMAAQAARFPPARWFRWLNAAVDAQSAMTGGEAVTPEIALEFFTTRTLGELTVQKAAVR